MRKAGDTEDQRRIHDLLDVTQLSHRKILVDTFVNAIYLHDDKIVITFSYKEGVKTVTFDEAKEAIPEENGSDLDCFPAPKGLSH